MRPPLRRRAVRCRHVDGPELVAVRIVVPGGARSEPLPGVCAVTGTMLEEGTPDCDWRRLGERIECRGMELAGFGDYDGYGVAVDCLADDWPRALEIALEVLSRSDFPAPRLEIVRRREEQVLRAIEESPEARAGWAFLDAIYEGGRRGTPPQGRIETLRAVGRDDCLAFHDRELAAGAIVVLAGRIDAARVRARIESLLAPVEEAQPLAPPTADEPGPGRAVRVDTEAGEQAHVYIGHRTVVRSDPDRLALVALGTILGGGAGNAGRIPRRLREELGLSYSTYAALAAGAGYDPGHLVLYAGTAVENVGAAIEEMRRELERLRERPVEAHELDAARSYILGREPFRRETGRQWASRLIDEELYGLDPRRGRLAERLNALTPDSLLEVARRVIRPDALHTVVGHPATRSR